jgi:hypothetical protein
MWANEIDYNSIRPAAVRPGAPGPEPGFSRFFPETAFLLTKCPDECVTILTYIP